MTGNPIAIFDVAARNARTIEVCVDRLQQLGANHELRLLTGRLQRLAFKAAPTEEEEDTSGCAEANEGRGGNERPLFILNGREPALASDMQLRNPADRKGVVE